MSMRIVVPALVVAALVVGSPHSALAQATAGSGGDAAAGLSTLLLTTGGIALSGIGCYVLTTKKDGERHAAAMFYLRQNALQVRQDVCFGRGPILDEMAAELRLTRAEERQLGVALRRDRRALLALADPAMLTPQRAWLFFETVRKLGQATNTEG